MKRKLLFFITMIALLVFLFAISVSAGALVNYASVDLTLVDGTEVTGYCKIEGRFLRDNVYKNPENTDDGVYAWGDIKVFDMRNSVIVGNKTYNEVGGLNCNSQAVNVEEYYFSSQVTKILNTTFTSGWKKLKTVYVPKTVKIIDSTAFAGSPVEQVVFEEGSQLESIGDSAFNKCANLTTITFPEGLKSLGYNCFWEAGLSGTIVIPNSVTYLGPGSLLSTKIENLYLGDGVLQIGHNFLGTFSKTDNPYLKNVYIPACTTFTATNIFYKCANSVNFYIVGSDEECKAMVTTLKSHSAGNYMTFITADEVTENTGAGYGIIHTGYSRCDAFYNGNHIDVQLSPCVSECSVCSNKTVNHISEYELITIEYEDGFMEKGEKTCACTSKGCTFKLNEEAQPLFACLGYSAPEDEGRYGITVSFTVNNTAIKEYKAATGKTLKYGVFIGAQNVLGNKDIFGEGGATINGVITAEITNYEFVAFDFNIFGFAEEQKDVMLAMGAYVAITGGEATEYSYMQEGTPNANEKYCFVSYNEIAGNK